MARGYPPEAQRHVVSASRKRRPDAPGIAGVEGVLATGPSLIVGLDNLHFVVAFSVFPPYHALAQKIFELVVDQCARDFPHLGPVNSRFRQLFQIFMGVPW